MRYFYRQFLVCLLLHQYLKSVKTQKYMKRSDQSYMSYCPPLFVSQAKLTSETFSCGLSAFI
jgi:hypothetical protein